MIEKSTGLARKLDHRLVWEGAVSSIVLTGSRRLPSGVDRPQPCHVETQFGLVSECGVKFGDYATFVHHQDAVCERQQFPQFGGYQQHSGPGVAVVDEMSMQE